MSMLFRPETEEMYNQHLALHGPGAKAMMMAPILHVSRLERAGRLLLRTKPASVMDIGCGLGFLVPYVPKDCHYVGIDPNVYFVEMARKNFMAPKRFFQVSDLETHAIPNQENLAQVVVALGVACHLHPSKDALQGFASLLQAHASKYMIVEFHNPHLYKGGFSAFDRETIQEAFCQRIRPEDVLTDKMDSTETILLRLRP